jgi:Ca2+-binding EF-hand superfamily protein
MVADLAKQAGCVLLDENENVNDKAMCALFKKFDQDSSGTIDKDELMQMAIVILGADKSVCGCRRYGCGIV